MANSQKNSPPDPYVAKILGLSIQSPVNEFFAREGHAGPNATFMERYGFPCMQLPDGVDSECHYGIRVPNNFRALVSGYPKLVIWTNEGSGNVRLEVDTNYGKSGENIINHFDSMIWTESVANGVIKEVDISSAFDAAALEKGDYIGIYVKRDGDHTEDTLTANLYVFGIVMYYQTE